MKVERNIDPGSVIGSPLPALRSAVGMERRSPLWFTLTVVSVCLLKLALTANQEIVAAARPHDDYWSILAAANWFWGRPYDEWAVIHLPVYPVLLAMIGSVGVPARLGTELIFLACAVMLMTSIARLGVSRGLQFVLLLALIFHPYTYFNFNFALAEMLLTPLMLALCAGLIFTWTAETRLELWLSTLFLSILAALVWNIRKENSILTAGFFAAVGIAILIFWKAKGIPGRRAVRYAVTLVAAPVLAAVALTVAIIVGNGVTFGIWRTHELAQHQYVRAYTALQAIQPDAAIRFVPVPRSSRMKAYEASPTFRKLKPILDGEREHWGASATRSWRGIEEQIAAGWFYWALRDAVARIGYYKTPQSAEMFYAQVADEIEAAFRNNRLQRRTKVWVPFLDPEFRLWLPFVPESVAKIGSLLFPTVMDGPDATGPISAKVITDYDLVAKRRALPSASDEMTLRGWAMIATGGPVVIDAVGAGEAPLPTTVYHINRPDLAFPADSSGRVGSAVGFEIRIPGKGLDPNSVRIRVGGPTSGLATSDPVAGLGVGRAMQLTAGSGLVVLALDDIRLPSTDFRDVIMSRMLTSYQWVLMILLAASLANVAYLVLARRRISPYVAIAACAVLLLIGSRVMLFAVLDASAWPGDQVRYILPVAILVPLLLILLLSVQRGRAGWISP